MSGRWQQSIRLSLDAAPWAQDPVWLHGSHSCDAGPAAAPWFGFHSLSVWPSKWSLISKRPQILEPQGSFPKLTWFFSHSGFNHQVGPIALIKYDFLSSPCDLARGGPLQPPSLPVPGSAPTTTAGSEHIISTQQIVQWLMWVPVFLPYLIPERSWGCWRKHVLYNKFEKNINRLKNQGRREIKTRLEEKLLENQASISHLLSTY